jgi:RNA recognition motif-containing protein
LRSDQQINKEEKMAIRLFVGNLPQNVTEAELREHFSTVGPISYLSLPTDRETGRQRGFAFIEFREPAQAEEAIRYFNNKSFKGNSLAVKEARAREDRGPSRPAFSRTISPEESPPASPSGTRPNPNFGPDASPHRTRGKAKNRLNSERASKGPMREVVRGQFFGEHDDDDDDDDVKINDEVTAGRDIDLDDDNT